MQVLQAPAVLHELDREPVEQFRVRGPFAADAEVVGRAHQALAEVPLPDAVDDDAGRERVVRRGDPLGQGRAPLLGGNVPRPVGARQLLRQAGRDHVAGQVQFAALEQADLQRRRAVRQHARRDQRWILQVLRRRFQAIRAALALAEVIVGHLLQILLALRGVLCPAGALLDLLDLEERQRRLDRQLAAAVGPRTVAVDV